MIVIFHSYFYDNNNNNSHKRSKTKQLTTVVKIVNATASGLFQYNVIWILVFAVVHKIQRQLNVTFALTGCGVYQIRIVKVV